MGRPRAIITPNAASPFMRAVQEAYVAAGSPEIRSLAKTAGVGHRALHDALTIGTAPETVRLLEAVLTALGYQVVLKPIAGRRPRLSKTSEPGKLPIRKSAAPRHWPDSEPWEPNEGTSGPGRNRPGSR